MVCHRRKGRRKPAKKKKHARKKVYRRKGKRYYKSKSGRFVLLKGRKKAPRKRR